MMSRCPFPRLPQNTCPPRKIQFYLKMLIFHYWQNVFLVGVCPTAFLQLAVGGSPCPTLTLHGSTGSTVEIYGDFLVQNLLHCALSFTVLWRDFFSGSAQPVRHSLPSWGESTLPKIEESWLIWIEFPTPGP